MSETDTEKPETPRGQYEVEYHTDRDRNREAIQTEMRKQKKKSQKHHEGSTRHTPGDIAGW